MFGQPSYDLFNILSYIERYGELDAGCNSYGGVPLVFDVIAKHFKQCKIYKYILNCIMLVRVSVKKSF